MENFKKFKGGPTPILPSGSQQFGKKTTTTTPTHATQPGQPHIKHRPKGHKGFGTEHDPKSPPVTPHHAGSASGLMSPVSAYGPLRGNPSPTVGHLRMRTMGAEPVLPKGSQEFTGKSGGSHTQQTRQPGHLRGHGAPPGGGNTRPYAGAGAGGPASVTGKPTGQQHTMAGGITPRMHVGMTKTIRGLIGKKPSHRTRSAY